MKSLTKWGPFGSQTYIDTESVFSQMNNIFQDVFGDFYTDEKGMSLTEKCAYPRLDIRDEGDKIVVEVEVPGLTREDVKVEVKNGVLVIRGDKRQEKEEKKGTYLRRELKRSSFSRQVCTLSSNCDADKIVASFTGYGLLTVTIPKKQVEPPKNDVKNIVVN